MIPSHPPKNYLEQVNVSEFSGFATHVKLTRSQPKLPVIQNWKQDQSYLTSLTKTFDSKNYQNWSGHCSEFGSHLKDVMDAWVLLWKPAVDILDLCFYRNNHFVPGSLWVYFLVSCWCQVSFWLRNYKIVSKKLLYA